ncbi:hypothetical protein [Klebsiella aerogenes]|uniref:hypothetical protein n=1 Tax=Klebsiella aerogenes TaxID=548 RepID=UPI0034D36B72
MDKFDRNRQRLLLLAMYDAYPNELSDETINAMQEAFQNIDILAANLIYLQSHELIKGAVRKMPSGDYSVMLFNAELTGKGIDFIRDDGGLGAVLGVQIVKIHDSTIVALEDILTLSNLPEEQKKGLIAKLRELPSDAIRHLTLQLLTKAALNPQATLHIIQTALHH